MATLVITIIALLITSGLSSLIEASLFSISLSKVKQLAESKTKSSIVLLGIKENMESSIATLVFINNAANIFGSIVVGNIAGTLLDNFWLGIFSAALTLLIIIVAEIIPKTVGEIYCDTVAPLFARPLKLVATILFPLVFVMKKITAPITKHRKDLTTSEEELVFLTEVGETQGVIESEEADIIKRVFTMKDVTAKDIMTPRVNMSYLYESDKIEDVLDEIKSSEHSRIIVIGETPDDVVGVAIKSDLLIAYNQCHGDECGAKPLVSSVMTGIHSFSENDCADDMLDYFKNSKKHIAIVRDEFNGVAGVVTLEDVVEIIFGEIMDETDKTEDLRSIADTN